MRIKRVESSEPWYELSGSYELARVKLSGLYCTMIDLTCINRIVEKLQKDKSRMYNWKYKRLLKNKSSCFCVNFREGILFALNPLQDPNNPGGPPTNLSFLEVISEFSGKLMKSDKKTV